MNSARSAGRLALLALSLLSGCAAGAPSAAGSDTAPGRVARLADDPGTAGLFLRGRVAGQQGDLDIAADAFLAALARDPDSELLQQQAFFACLLTGRPEALRLAGTQPGNPLAQLLLIDADMRHRDWPAAQARITALPRQGITQILQPLLLAWTQAGSGRADAALATLRPFAQGDRFRPIYVFHAALVADLGERDGEARRLYDQTRTEFATPNLQVTRSLASWHARRGDSALAARELDALLASNGDLAIAGQALRAHVADRPVRSALDGVAEAYVALAAALRDQGSTEFAALLLRLAVDARPDLAGARLLAAEVDEQVHRPLAALHLLEGVAADDPLAALVQLRRAALLERLDRSDEALTVLDGLQRQAADRPEPWTLRGAILRQRHDFTGAVAAYDQSAARIPQPTAANWPLFYERGIAHERAGQWAQAEADFNHALALSPDQPSVLNYLGYSWTEQGRNLGQARQMIERAATQRPNDGAILDSLGWVMLRAGSTGEAVRNLERAVELEPEDATINGHLGDAYSAAHRHDEALFQWRRALTLNPEPDETQRIEKRLRESGEAPQPRPAAGQQNAGSEGAGGTHQP